MRCAKPPRGLDAASLSWSATQSAKSCSSRRLRVQLPSGMASHSDRPWNTIVSTTRRLLLYFIGMFSGFSQKLQENFRQGRTQRGIDDGRLAAPEPQNFPDKVSYLGHIHLLDNPAWLESSSWPNWRRTSRVEM
jgi:hypothetical protein